MSGFGRSENPNILSFMFGFATLVVLFGSYTVQYPTYGRALRAAIALFFIFIIFLAKSRGPGVALLLAIAVTACFSRSKWIVGLWVISLSLIGVIFLFNPESLHSIIQRADSYRFEIWKQAVPAMLEKPLFGHGIGSNFAFDVSHPSVPPQSSAHNVLLGTFLYGGVVGLSLLLALGFNALVRAVRLGRDNQTWLPFSLLVFGGIAMQFSGHTLFLNLNHEWWYSWVPLAYIIASSTRRWKHDACSHNSFM
jgi:O-antigen ligase